MGGRRWHRGRRGSVSVTTTIIEHLLELVHAVKIILHRYPRALPGDRLRRAGWGLPGGQSVRLGMGLGVGQGVGPGVGFRLVLLERLVQQSLQIM